MTIHLWIVEPKGLGSMKPYLVISSPMTNSEASRYEVVDDVVEGRVCGHVSHDIEILGHLAQTTPPPHLLRTSNPCASLNPFTTANDGGETGDGMDRSDNISFQYYINKEQTNISLLVRTTV
jgi:hypothetical protein